MFEKNMRIAFLLDFYGEVLDEHTRSIMRAYYEDDLSLAEIAEGVGISRQGVRHTIKHAEEQLEFLEQALSLAEAHRELSALPEGLKKIGEELRRRFGDEAEDLAAELDGVAEKIIVKGI